MSAELHQSPATPEAFVDTIGHNGGYPADHDYDFAAHMRTLDENALRNDARAKQEAVNYPMGRNVEGYLPMSKAADIDWSEQLRNLHAILLSSDSQN